MMDDFIVIGFFVASGFFLCKGIDWIRGWIRRKFNG